MQSRVRIVCELCVEPCDAYAQLGGDVVIVDRDKHGLGGYALVGRLLLRVVPDGEPTMDGTIRECDTAGLSRYRAHEDTCRKLKRSRPVSQKTTRRTGIRERRSR